MAASPGHFKVYIGSIAIGAGVGSAIGLFAAGFEWEALIGLGLGAAVGELIAIAVFADEVV